MDFKKSHLCATVVTVLSIFALCEMFCIELLLMQSLDSLMVWSRPSYLHSCFNKFMILWCFCSSVGSCISDGLFFFLVLDDVVGQIVYVDDYFGNWIDSFLEPCCDVFNRLLKANVCDDFIIHLTKFS